ncbi:MAG: hypothetical protein EPN79_02215 [Burkholderiaceae bacterium]|nr:MAG: hypothetical protein EPN79_02215 [Burkholderiaceae bacterium]TBR76150.1 MAG: hypothetical protein EPN64_09060 [Burkholderiaceae bacterium]
MNLENLDSLGSKIAYAAMTIMVRTCRIEVAAASNADVEAALASMRARARVAVDQLLDDAQGAPWIAETAAQAAAFELAEAGIATLRERCAIAGTAR